MNNRNSNARRGTSRRQIQQSLITVRGAVIAVVALAAGGIVAWLLILAGHHPAEAALAGLCSAGGATVALNQLID